MRYLYLNSSGGRTKLDVAPERIAEMTDEQRAELETRFQNLVKRERDSGRMVVKTFQPGETATQVFETDPLDPQAKYESIPAIAGG